MVTLKGKMKLKRADFVHGVYARIGEQRTSFTSDRGATLELFETPTSSFVLYKLDKVTLLIPLANVRALTPEGEV